MVAVPSGASGRPCRGGRTGYGQVPSADLTVSSGFGCWRSCQARGIPLVSSVLAAGPPSLGGSGLRRDRHCDIRLSGLYTVLVRPTDQPSVPARQRLA